jgi:hypothetical protein
MHVTSRKCLVAQVSRQHMHHGCHERLSLAAMWWCYHSVLSPVFCEHLGALLPGDGVPAPPLLGAAAARGCGRWERGQEGSVDIRYVSMELEGCICRCNTRASQLDQQKLPPAAAAAAAAAAAGGGGMQPVYTYRTAPTNRTPSSTSTPLDACATVLIPPNPILSFIPGHPFPPGPLTTPAPAPAGCQGTPGPPAATPRPAARPAAS